MFGLFEFLLLGLSCPPTFGEKLEGRKKVVKVVTYPSSCNATFVS